MTQKIKLPTASTLIMFVVILAAITTWILPAGQYSKLSNDNNKAFVITSSGKTTSLPFSQRTLDSLSIKVSLSKFINGDISRPISVPGTYQVEKSRPQGPIAILQAPVKGIVESIDIVLVIMIIGGFMHIFNGTGAMVKGIAYLASRMKGRERLLIIVLTFIFSFLGGSYGMDVESIAFYPILVPLFIAAGYDVMVPLAIIFGGAAIGYISSFSNPFSTIIASNTIGISWMQGFYERVLYFVISTTLYTWYILRYAGKVKKSPQASLVYQIDGITSQPIEPILVPENEELKLTVKTKLLLLLFLATFVSMIVGIVFFGWWTTEMSTLFLSSAIVVAIIERMGEKTFVTEFTHGMASLLSVAIIVGLARGVTIILNDGLISDTILFHASNLVQHFHPALFILMMLLFYFFFTIPVTSSSGMAVLTMPIIGTLAIMLNIPGREIVNSYLFGIGIMYLITPTGSIFPALGMVNVSYKAWLKFIMPFVIVLLIISAIFLIIGIRF